MAAIKKEVENREFYSNLVYQKRNILVYKRKMFLFLTACCEGHGCVAPLLDLT